MLGVLGPLEEGRDEADDLHGLAQAHVVGQDRPALRAILTIRKIGPFVIR